MKSPIKEKGTRTATFFGGVLVLTLANIFVKLFGFLYKVPLNRLLGDEMANVNAAYSVYFLRATMRLRLRFIMAFMRCSTEASRAAASLLMTTAYLQHAETTAL